MAEKCTIEKRTKAGKSVYTMSRDCTAQEILAYAETQDLPLRIIIPHINDETTKDLIVETLKKGKNVTILPTEKP